MKNTNNKNLATFTHLSTLSQYCIPFGNYIFPILIGSSNKTKSGFIDFNAKQILNFKLSMLLCTLILAMIAIPTILITVFSNMSLETIIKDGKFMIQHFSVENTTGIAIVAILTLILFVSLKVAKFFLIIDVAVLAPSGKKYK